MAFSFIKRNLLKQLDRSDWFQTIYYFLHMNSCNPFSLFNSAIEAYPQNFEQLYRRVSHFSTMINDTDVASIMKIDQYSNIETVHKLPFSYRSYRDS